MQSSWHTLNFTVKLPAQTKLQNCQVLEYSELDPKLASATDPSTGQLHFNWSNICMHYFAMPWLAKTVKAGAGSVGVHVNYNMRCGPPVGFCYAVPGSHCECHQSNRQTHAWPGRDRHIRARRAPATQALSGPGAAYHIARKAIPSKGDTKVGPSTPIACCWFRCRQFANGAGPHVRLRAR